MKTDSQVQLHNRHAPAVLRMLMEPMARGETTLSGTMVMTESVLFGVLLVAAHHGKSPAMMLDAVYAAVQERLEAEIAKGAL